MRKILPVIIVIIITLSLVSCKTTNSNDLKQFTNDDKYKAIELFKAIELDSIQKITPFSNGNFLVGGWIYLSEKSNVDGSRKVDPKYLLVDESGKTLKELDIDIVGFSRRAMTIDSNNNIIFLSLKDQFLELLTYNMEGEFLKEEKLELKEDVSSNSFRKIEVSETGLIYGLTYKGDIFVVDDKCNIVDVIKQENNITDFDILQENKILFVDTGGYLSKYDTDKKEIIKRHELDKDLRIQRIEYQRDKSLIYSQDERFISILKENGELKQRVFNYIVNTQISEVREIFEFEESLYLYAFKTDNSNALFKLEEIDNKTAETNIQEDELVIAANGLLINNLDKAVQSFKAANPDIKVSLVENKMNVFENGHLSQEQFFQVINTELMTGKGPDIIWGHFPFDAYMKEGYMVDLMDYMNSDNEFNNDDYIENIVELSRVDEKQYVFPVNFRFSKIYANKRILQEHGITIDEENWTYRDMEKIIEEICREGTYYSFNQYGSYSLMELSIKNNIDYLIDFENKKVNFNTTEFRDLLRKLKTIRSYEYPDSGANPNIIFVHSDFDSYGYRYDPALNNAISSFEDYELIKMPKWKKDSTETFRAKFAGINSNSKLKDEAWEFIKFITSENYGIEYVSPHFFPINKGANAWINELNLNGSNEIETSFGIQTRNIDDKYKMSKKHSDKLKEIIEEKNYYSFLSLPIYGEMNKFTIDIQDMEQTIKNIENKTKLFIGE